MADFKVCVRIDNEPKTVTIMGATSQREARARAHSMAMSQDTRLTASQVKVGVAYQDRH